MSEKMNFLNSLNPQQYTAVTAGSGQILVIAGPGSGKTRVLTHRIAYLIRALGIPPYNILAVTFTNKAAREMQSRVENLLETPVEGLWLGTFHAMCARMLRRESANLPFDSSFVIMDADDQEILVKRAIRELNLDDKLYRPNALHAAISNAKNNLQLPKDIPSRSYREEVLIRVYERYQRLLVESNSVDFDDLLLWSVRLLEENPSICEKYAHRFQHVLVDEFQDTNMAQYQLLRSLSSYHNNLFVVGDEDQSIYRWRGADYRNVIRFEENYPNTQKILLEQNYRSTQNVLDAARAVIDHNQHRTPKHLFSERGSGDRISLYEAVDDHAEAAYVVDTIQQLMNGQKMKGGGFAVMYRTNAQSRLLEEAFLRVGLPYRLVGAQRFYGRREVKDMIAYLRMVHNPSDEISLSRMINVPPRGIGEKTLVALQLAARQAETSPGAVLIDLGKHGADSPFWSAFSGRGAVVMADFGSLLAGWREALHGGLPLPTLFDRIVSETGYENYVEDASEEGLDRWANVQELRKLAYEYQDRGIVEFLENLALVSDQDTLPEKVDAPTLLTLHAAKGLEFDRVFIIGLDEGLLPHSRSAEDPEEMAEERRLFYVGLTRARNQVYLVRASQRSTYGSYDYSTPSRFLEDIPSELIYQPGERRFSRTKTVNASRWESQTQPVTVRSTRSTPPPSRSAPLIQPTFKATQRVHHPVWGEGVILESRIEDGEEVVDIHFASVGFKRLLVSLAKLEPIG
jgi:DNA helicase II / ATP-dependent DNA helicase PcrA